MDAGSVKDTNKQVNMWTECGSCRDRANGNSQRKMVNRLAWEGIIHQSFLRVSRSYQVTSDSTKAQAQMILSRSCKHWIWLRLKGRCRQMRKLGGDTSWEPWTPIPYNVGLPKLPSIFPVPQIKFCWKIFDVKLVGKWMSKWHQIAFFSDLTRGVGYFSHWCHQIPDKNQLKGERAHFCSWFKGRVWHHGEGIGTGIFMVWKHEAAGSHLTEQRYKL